jgi:hypothetical protein
LSIIWYRPLSAVADVPAKLDTWPRLIAAHVSSSPTHDASSQMPPEAWGSADDGHLGSERGLTNPCVNDGPSRGGTGVTPTASKA